jgi:signal transduction histidine kinase
MTWRDRLIPQWFSITLRTKLVGCTALTLIMACFLLGWLFVQQQVRLTAESAVQSGMLLAQHLAQMSHSSIVAVDIPRLNYHVQQILAADPVAYAAIISPNGDLLAGIGKGAWQDQLFSQETVQHRFTPTTLVRALHRANLMNEPLISTVDLRDTGPVIRDDIDMGPRELLALAVGTEVPIFYDITVPVPRYPPASAWDPALQLTLDERSDKLEENAVSRLTPTALVQVGLSTFHLQYNLRRLLWYAVIMTLSTLIGGLAVAVWLARRITIPLHNLTVATSKLAAGDTVPLLDIPTRDEIGTLTAVFNHMATALHSREHELRELTHSLEDRVTTRTQELAAANTKLQELDRRKSIFVSTASHELRTPLTSMKVHVANLFDGVDGEITAEQRRSLLRIEANLSRLQTLIDDLLDLSQIEMGQISVHVKPVAVGHVIAKAIEDLRPLASEHRVKVMMTLESDLPDVSADPDKLHQVILNLAHNAVKFTRPDTTVDVSAIVSSDGHVTISVADSGPGMTREDAEKVFQPFYRISTPTRQPKGAGLGLAIAKLLVELHHGRLWVETVPGRGSCFSFTMRPAPRTQPAIAEAVPQIAPYQPLSDGKR